MKDVYEEDPEDEFSIERDWIEAMENTQPGGGDSISAENAQAVIVVETDPRKRRSMCRKVLGFAYADPPVIGGPAPRLHRELPVAHPEYPWMRATAISFSQFPPDGSDNTLKRPAALPQLGVREQAKYQRVFATVVFRPVRYLCVPDFEIATNADEIRRWVYWQPSYNVGMLSAEGSASQMFWAETNPVPPAPAPQPSVTPPNNVIPQAFGTLVSKTVYSMVWNQVPHEWLSSEDYPMCKLVNFDRCVGRVNSVPFGPFPAGTLCMQAPRVEPYQWNVATFNGRSLFCGWNVIVPFEFFDPDKGVVNDPPGTSPWRGFRTLPWSGNGKWYHATRANPNEHLLPEADFYQIFGPARLP